MVSQYADAMRLAGHILDIYDDPKATVLLEKLAGRPLPEKLASSRLLDANELAALPDRLYAVVAANGESTLRKYAMHDEAHLATSILYFLERGHVFPEDVQKVAANRLVEACGWYGVEPPEALEKIAFLGPLANVAGKAFNAYSAVTGVRDIAQKARQGMGQVRRDFATGTLAPKLGSHEIFDNKAQANLEKDEERRVQRGGPLKVTPDADAKSVTQMTPTEERSAQKNRTTPGAVQRVLDNLGALGDEKKADLNGTADVMPRGALTKPTGRSVVANATKTAGLSLSGYEVPAAVRHETYEVFAHPHTGRYPIDTPELVKKAERYFDENLQAFTPFERRVFAQSVWDRSHELGTKVAGSVLSYAGDGYGPHIDDELRARISRYEGTGHEVIYETLLEKRAEIDPAVMTSILAEADTATGASEVYGRPAVGFLDPFAAVYGVKTAEEDKAVKDTNYTWKDGTEYVTGMQILSFAKRGPGQLTAHFGESFGRDFVKDPVGIFKSMPEPQKKMMARLMSSHSVAGAGD